MSQMWRLWGSSDHIDSVIRAKVHSRTISAIFVRTEFNGWSTTCDSFTTCMTGRYTPSLTPAHLDWHLRLMNGIGLNWIQILANESLICAPPHRFTFDLLFSLHNCWTTDRERLFLQSKHIWLIAISTYRTYGWRLIKITNNLIVALFTFHTHWTDWPVFVCKHSVSPKSLLRMCGLTQRLAITHFTSISLRHCSISQN